MNQKSLVSLNKTVDYSNVGSEITYELAQKMIKDYADAQKEENVKCMVYGKTALLEILSQPGCVGIRQYYALNELGEKTFVLIGIDQSGKNLIDLAVDQHGKIVKTEGMIFDHYLPESYW